MDKLSTTEAVTVCKNIMKEWGNLSAKSKSDNVNQRMKALLGYMKDYVFFQQNDNTITELEDETLFLYQDLVSKGVYPGNILIRTPKNVETLSVFLHNSLYDICRKKGIVKDVFH